MLVTLPNGFIDGADHFDHVEVDELKGKQQNYLADRELVINNIGHIPKILIDLILSFQTKEGLQWKGKISEVIWKLPSGDLETILIKIRETTYGPKFYLESECTHCGKMNKNLRLDLDKLELKKLSIEQLVEKKIVQLPKMKLETELKPIYLADLFESIKVAKEKQNMLVTSLLATSLKRIGDKSPIKSEDVENIPASDILHITNEMEKIVLEGNIDTNIDSQCTECKKEFNSKLNCLDVSFFDPTKGSMS